MPPIITSGPEDRAPCTRSRTALIARDDYPRTHVKLGSISRGEDHASKSPASIRLYLFELSDHRESRRELTQDAHQSRRNLHRDKCPSASHVEQRVQRQAKSSPPSSIPSINTQVFRRLRPSFIDRQTRRPDLRAVEVVSARRRR
ncbi:hypothetical protein F511_22109 [Dorcoceras hygrometricum]|uniref:Uncharacterized protein n=1 Tax=Dorcoceras hygrometricum TaxID=472368 RepID=A0A2Z7B638_9LAMI|nr:hypothetical protein F511_22109 [Dorcoceras hygrometricum]